jgi:hypothetical protein
VYNIYVGLAFLGFYFYRNTVENDELQLRLKWSIIDASFFMLPLDIVMCMSREVYDREKSSSQ